MKREKSFKYLKGGSLKIKGHLLHEYLGWRKQQMFKRDNFGTLMGKASNALYLGP